MEKRLLTIKEIAEEFDVSTRTISNWMKHLGLPCVKLGPKLIRFDKGEIYEFFGVFDR